MTVPSLLPLTATAVDVNVALRSFLKSSFLSFSLSSRDGVSTLARSIVAVTVLRSGCEPLKVSRASVLLNRPQ